MRFHWLVICLTLMSCEWGRLGAKRYHRKVDVFHSLDDAIAQVKRLEAMRIKHHYQVA